MNPRFPGLFPSLSPVPTPPPLLSVPRTPPSTPQELHIDTELRMGQMFMHFTKTVSASCYCGDGSRRGPTMEQILDLAPAEIEDRICALAGCPPSRLAYFKEHDKGVYNTVTRFWQLLQPKKALNPFMRSTPVEPGDILLSGGPLIHYGPGSPKGQLRIIAFATIGEEYDDDSQVTEPPPAPARARSAASVLLLTMSPPSR